MIPFSVLLRKTRQGPRFSLVVFRPHKDSSAWHSLGQEVSLSIIDPTVYCRGECKIPLPWGYAMLMNPNEDETAVPGCHYRGHMLVRMRKVLVILRSWYVCFSAEVSIDIPSLGLNGYVPLHSVWLSGS